MISRRTWLKMAIVATPGLAFAQPQGQDPLTPSQFAGPFYPVEPIPILPDLTRFQGGQAQGQLMDLYGRVLNRSGQPLPNVRLEIWQSDTHGRYRHPKAPEHEQLDPHFAGFAAVETDAAGNYRFRTILPVPYTGRPPHIHARLHRGTTELLTTQLYLDGQERENNALFNMVATLYGDRRLLTIKPEIHSNGMRSAAFDFVLDV